MKDYRGRTIQYKDGKRIKHLPKRSIEKCFEIETIAWEIHFTSKIDNKVVFIKLASREREIQFKSENKELFIFN